MHEIISPIDLTYSIQGTEWHGLSNHVEKIDTETVEPLLFPIETQTPVVVVGGVEVPLAGHKAIIGNLSHRPELADYDGENRQIVPLHVAKDSYKVIPNRDLWEMTMESIKGLGCTVSTAGTLGAGKFFYISVSLDGNEGFSVEKDKFLANFNVITSHNGSMAVEAYDSLIRIVCMNTLRWSRSEKGELKFKVFHTKNAPTAISNMGEVINQILSGRVEFVNQMGYLKSVPCNHDRALNLVAGWIGGELSTQSMNRITEIAELFARGKGNHGQNLYDLFNGCTEYFTSGSGTGKKATKAEKWAKAEFGKPSEQKRDFLNFLMGKPDMLDERAELGKKLIVEYFAK